jgi:hypothetical protein
VFDNEMFEVEEVKMVIIPSIDNVHICFNDNLAVKLDVYYLDKLVESVELPLIDLEDYLTLIRNDNLDEIYNYVVKVSFIDG